MTELADGAKRRRQRVMILAEEIVAARWAQALAEDGVVCLIAANVSAAAKVLHHESALELMLVDRAFLDRQFQALTRMFVSVGRWPVIVPIKNGGRKPTKVDRSRVGAALTLLRSSRRSAEWLRLGDLTIDLARKRAKFRRRKWVQLPPMQYQILVTLAQRPNEVLGFRELLRQVWGYDGSKAEAQELLKAHVRLIRRKMRWNPQTGEYLRSVRGFGYMLSVPE
ncbi:MAG TPA: winged helix-turn-helix domain-containing protein [Anaerolineae bacterium]|nr:winged helix-turn-helix domain-containing protein [Anaerolineae bacterium]